MVQCSLTNSVVLGSSPVAVTETSDVAPASIKELLDIHAIIEDRFTLKRVRDMTRTYSQMHGTVRYLCYAMSCYVMCALLRSGVV